MLLKYGVISLVLASGLYCDDFTSANNYTVSDAEEAKDVASIQTTEGSPVNVAISVQPPTTLPYSAQLSKKPARRRGRRFRGYYNDFRYRDPSNNPYNPNSPYSFRGRPARPLPVYNTGYNAPQYYDPYNQYYGYQQSYYQPQAGYYPYPQPYQPQPLPPHPPTPPPTERLPDLYYVQSADGQYQYKRVPVQDTYGDRNKRRPTNTPVYPQQPYGQQGYYNHASYPYGPYDQRPPPPNPHQYYQQYPYNQQQYPQYYQYPKVPGGPRSRLRGGLPPLRSTALPNPTAWKLTTAPTGVFDLKHNQTPSEFKKDESKPATEQTNN